MSNLFYYFVCGIFSGANNPREWSNQAQAWVRDNGYCDLPGGFTYFDSVAGAILHDDQQADLIAEDLDEAISDGMIPDVVTHSNGGRIIAHMLRRHPNTKIGIWHAIACADSPDCDVNRINDAVTRGQIQKIVFYVSPIDEILSLPVVSYGTMGLSGPRNMSPATKAIVAIVEEPMKHCEWVNEKFEQTMRQVVAVTLPDSRTYFERDS